MTNGKRFYDIVVYLYNSRRNGISSRLAYFIQINTLWCIVVKTVVAYLNVVFLSNVGSTDFRLCDIKRPLPERGKMTLTSGIIRKICWKVFFFLGGAVKFSQPRAWFSHYSHSVNWPLNLGGKKVFSRFSPEKTSSSGIDAVYFYSGILFLTNDSFWFGIFPANQSFILKNCFHYAAVYISVPVERRKGGGGGSIWTALPERISRRGK